MRAELYFPDPDGPEDVARHGIGGALQNGIVLIQHIFCEECFFRAVVEAHVDIFILTFFADQFHIFPDHGGGGTVVIVQKFGDVFFRIAVGIPQQF